MGGDDGSRIGTGERAPRHRRHARRDDIGQSAQPFGIRRAPGFADRKRMIDHRPAGVAQHRARSLETFGANIGIADAVEDHVMGGQCDFGVVIFAHQNAGLENLFIEQRSGRRVAAGGRDQKQDPDRRPLAAIRQRGQEMVLKTLVAMRPRARRVADLGQQIAHAAVGMNVAGIGAQRGFEMRARRVVLVEQEQQRRQIDPAHRIVGMVTHRFAEQRARRVLISGVEDEIAEIVQHAEIGRPALQEFEIIRFGRLVGALLAMQPGTLETGREGVGIARQHAIELFDARLRRVFRTIAHGPSSCIANQWPKISRGRCRPRNSRRGGGDRGKGRQ